MINEEARLEELRRYDILDSEAEPAFDGLARLAAHALSAPIALITLIDERRQWRKAAHGLPREEMPRDLSFCNHAIGASDTMVVEDARDDARFAALPLVTGETAVRFYAGAPLVTAHGHALGTICVLDRAPRRLAGPEADALRLLGGQVMNLLEARRELLELRRSESLREEAVEALLATKTDLEKRIELRTRDLEHAHANTAESERRLREAQAVAHVGSWEWSVAENRVRWTDEMYRIYGLGPEQFDGSYEGFIGRLYPEDVEYTKSVIGDAYQRPRPFVYDHRIVRPDGSVRMLHTRGDVVTDGHGRPSRMVGSCWDITERWQAEHAAEESAFLLNALVETTPRGVLVLDLAGRVKVTNRHFVELFAVPEALLAGDGDALLAHVASRLSDGEAWLARVRELRGRPEAHARDLVHPSGGGCLLCHSWPYFIGAQPSGRAWLFDPEPQDH